MQTETCRNCGRIIGNLETRYLFGGQIVCDECDRKLRSPISDTRPQQNISTNVPETRSVSAFGIVSVVIGTVACLLCWIPFAGCLAIPLGFLGMLFALIGALVSLVDGRTGPHFPFAGAVVCIIATYIAFVTTQASVDTINAISEAAK